MRNAHLNIRPTSGALGAEIADIDLSRGLDADEIAGIRKALGEHGVVFFRDQKLTPEQHIAFAESVGTINVNRFFKAAAGIPTTSPRSSA